MQLITLRIHNFKSFKGEHLFKFPEDPGLFCLHGENHQEPRLDANGAGKSTLWDALTWMLYGTTPLGLRAGDVGSWDTGKRKPKVSVKLTYCQGGSVNTISRTWNPNSFTLENSDGVHDLTKDESNPFVGDLCRSGRQLDLPGFLSSIYFAQGHQTFLDLSPTAKASLFTEILDLDSWNDHSEKSAVMAREAELRIKEVDTQISGDRQLMQTLSNLEFDQISDEWDSQNADEISRLNRSVAAGIESAEVCKKRIARMDEVLRDCIDVESEVRLEIEEKEREYKKAQSSSRKLLEKKSQADANYQAAVNRQYLFESKSECPTCGHSFGFLSTKPKIDHLRKQADLLLKIRAATQDEYLQAYEKQEVLLKSIEGLRSSLVGPLAETRRKNERIGYSLVRELDKLEEGIESGRKEIRRLEKLRNPHKDRSSEVEAELRAVKVRISDKEKELDFLKSSMSGYSWWVKGFKDIRLTQIDKALVQLEIECNSSLMQLGLIGWSLRFDVSKTTKTSGKSSKGFFVMVQSPTMKEPVPWECWSGGEAQRLRLAASLGLSNLMRSTYGIDMSLEIWDEPTKYLSAEGVSDLLECLRQRAEGERRQIWLVDHRIAGGSDFSASVVITKDAQGTSGIGDINWENQLEY